MSRTVWFPSSKPVRRTRIQSGPLTVRVSRPFDAETPVREFTSWVTPNEQFFVRSHFGPPNAESMDASSWRLNVGGLVDRGLTLSLGDLKQIPAVTIPAVLQCSGNGRAHHRPKVPGVQWERGAVGNAQWTGVRLRDVLQRAGVTRAEPALCNSKGRIGPLWRRCLYSCEAFHSRRRSIRIRSSPMK